MNTSDVLSTASSGGIAGLVDAARGAGVVLWLHEGQLRFRCEQSARCDVVLESLRPRKSEVIAFLAAEQAREAGSAAGTPLSFAQERLWFIGQLGLAGEAYHNASAVRIDGPLDCAALARALVLLTHRHESLRTRFAVQDGRAVQIVDRARRRVMATSDLSRLRASQAELALREIADEQAARAFDLEAGHLVRVLLVRRSAREHLLFLTLHHIISDASSLGILVRDLMVLYAEAAVGWPASLPALPIRYRDFSRWQHDSRANERLDAYWRKALEGVPTFLRLPTSYPRPPVADFVGADIPFELSRQTTQTLKRIAERAGATLFMATLAIFQILLYRITAQKEFIVGTLTSGRPWPELEEMIGVFVNTLPLRTAVDDELSFLDVLRRARRTTLEAFANQTVPFQSIVQVLEPARDLSRQPVVQVMFMYRNIIPPAAPVVPGLAVRTLVPRSRSTQFDLMFNAHEEEGALHGQFLYATQLFERVFMQRLAESFCHLAEHVAARPDTRIVDISLHENADTVLAKAWYWRRMLADAPPELALPADGSRQTQRHGRGGEVMFELDVALARGVNGLAARANADVSAVLCGAYVLLLSWLSGQDDLVVGITTSNGSVANTLPVRLRVDRSCLLEDWVQRVRAQRAAACAYQSMRLEDVLELMVPARGGTPPLDVRASFEFQSPMRAGEKASTRFDLTLHLEERDQAFHAVFAYAADLFDRSTVERWAGHFRTLVAEMIAAPVARLGELRVMSERQRRQILNDFNDTRVTLPGASRVDEMFAAQVARAPTAVAVVQGGHSLTYDELNVRANQLARYLRARGIGAGDRVGICIDRSPEMLWLLLGVLKAGAAYVPLDPTYPAQRLAFMLEDAAPAVVLTRSCLMSLLPRRTDVVPLERMQEEISEQLGSNCVADEESLAGGGLAYIMYTSGSTGRPKGVMIEHSALSNYLCWAAHTYGKLESQGAPVSSPLAFDATITSLFVPLLLGRPVLLVRDGEEVQGLARMLLTGRLGPVKITPAHLGVLGRLRSDSGERDPPHTFVIGGEALAPATVDLWRSICPGVRLFNEYGPTETVVGCCVYDASAAPPGGRSIPIGRPIWNTRMYILNAALEPVPIGVVGEIFIGGAGVAWGYVNRPELSAERFLCDPFSMQAGARMYRTGDLGRWRADGNIECQGRNDHQVKIRGFRIESGEVEASLRAHPRIQECVVEARATGAGDKSLVAYYTVRGNGAPNIPELRAHLRRNLPDYMVPAAFVPLEAMPLTSNGKLDRGQLPAPGSAPNGPTDEEPRGEIELALARIWCELLGRPRVGRHDNFFELGGHSLLSALCATRLKARLGLDLPLAAFFHRPTLAKLAAAASNDMPARASASGPTLFLFHPIGGHGLQYRELAQHLTGFGGIHPVQRPELRSGAAVLFRSIDPLIEIYVQEVLSAQPAGPYYLGGWSLGARLAVQVAAALEARGRPVEFIGLIDGPISYERPIDFDTHLLELADRPVADVVHEWTPHMRDSVRRAWEQNPAHRVAVSAEQGREIERYFHLFVANAWLGLVAGLPPPVRPRRAHVYCASRTIAGAAEIQTLESTLESVFACSPRVTSLPADHYDILRTPVVARLAASLSQEAYCAQGDATRTA